MKIEIKKTHKITSTFIFSESELKTILIDHINSELGKKAGFHTAIRYDDCIFRARYDDYYMIESERRM